VTVDQLQQGNDLVAEMQRLEDEIKGWGLCVGIVAEPAKSHESYQLRKYELEESIVVISSKIDKLQSDLAEAEAAFEAL